MSPQDLPSDECAPSATSPDRVTLSKWVNERFPPWEQLLSAHDVARLTRRPRWVLLGLAVLGRFPRERRFHSRAIGWLRADVLDWLAKDLRNERCHAYSAPLFRRRIARQTSLPLEASVACAARRRRKGCSLREGDER